MPTPYVYNLPTDTKTRERIQLLADYLLSLNWQSPTDSPTTWLLPVRCEPLNVDPALEADGLIGNVLKFLSERYGVKGHRVHAQIFDKMPLKSMAAYSASDGELSTKLGFVCYEKSIYAFILGNCDSPNDTNTRPWIEALGYAERERATGYPFHEWCALIGLTHTKFGQTTVLLDDQLTIGELSLEPCNFTYEERHPLASLSSWSRFSWVPIIVRGRSRGHDWRAAEFTALREVHRICALLSVETASHWILREGPRPVEWGPIHLPDVTPLGLVKRDRFSEQTNAQPFISTNIDSARLSRMWRRCLEDDSLGAPVEAYYEAVSLRDEHPSFALVGFVAAIEEVGKLLIEAPTTERCPTCKKEKTSGSAERFRAALRLVLPEEKLQDVSRDLYRWRSGTAHAGRTYAWESSFGRPLMGNSFLSHPTQLTFGVTGSMWADDLARKLVLNLLNGKVAISGSAT